MRLLGLAALAVAMPFPLAIAQNGGPRNARIVGVVADSVSGAPLQGAEIIASGVTTLVLTDSLGRFTIDSLAPGTYQVGVFHPLLESLGITLATKPFVIGPDSAGVVSLAVPSVPTLVLRYCGAQQGPSTPAAVAGRVLDPDTDLPIAGAKVSLAWTDVTVSKETGVVRNPHELHSETSGTGFFKFCGLPTELYGTLQATKGAAATPEVPVSMNGALLEFQGMSIPDKPDTHATGIVTGHVVSAAGNPVAGARVEIPVSAVSTLTRDDGAFYLAGVRTGTEVLVARSLSFATAAEAINVTSRQPIDVIVTLPDKVNVLDPVLVTARREYALDKAGFSARKRAGGGYFFTRQDIDRRRPNNITDMLKNLPMLGVSSQRGGTVITSRRGVTSMYSPVRSCTRVFIDGFEWRDMGPGDLDMFVNPEDVIGLEVYRPEDVPSQFRRVNQNCVAVVVWTQFRGKANK
jgi:hypothetical protein